MQNPKLYGVSKGQKSYGVPLWGKNEMSSALNADPDSTPTPAFQADFTSSITPQIGSAGTFTRAGARSYWSGPFTIASAADGVPAIPAYQFGNNSVAGLALHGPTRNYALRSEAIGTTWAAVGAPVITAVVGTGYGGINFGSIAGNSGEGITQTLSLAAADTTIMFSFYAVALTNPVTVRIVIEGSSGGTPETQNQDVIVVPINLTQPARYYAPAKLFTAGATGDVKVSVLLQETGAILIGGLMAERKETDSSTDIHTRIPGPYIATAGAEVATAADVLTYPAASITNVETFSFEMWVNTDFRGFANSTAYRDGSPSADDKYMLRVRDAGSNVIIEFLPGYSNNATMRLNGGSLVQTLYERHHEKRWYHYVLTVDYANDSYKIYRNGVLYIEDTEVRATPGAANDFYIGFPTAYRAPNAIIRHFRYYDSVLTAEQVAARFNATVGEHLESQYKPGWPLTPNWHDPFTVLFYDFTEASGNLTDEISGRVATATGTPSYSNTYTGRWAGFTGIGLPSGAAFRHLTAIPEMDFDAATTNLIVEIWMEKLAVSGEQNLVTALGHGGTSDYMWRIYFLDDLTLRLDIQDDGGATENFSWTLPQSLVDGEPHKLRFEIGFNSLAKLWIDEVKQAEYAESTGDCTCEGIRIGEKYDGSGDNFLGEILGLRVTQADGDASVTMTNAGGPILAGSD